MYKVKFLKFILFLIVIMEVVGICSVNAGDTTAIAQVLSGGATFLSNTNYLIKGTIGQSVSGKNLNNIYVLSQGFWSSFQNCCIGMRGNIDGDPGEVVAVSDLTYLVDFLFSGGPTPSCLEEADVDGNGSEPNVADLTFLISYLFQGSYPPKSCL